MEGTNLPSANLFRRIKRDKQAVQAQRIRQAFGLQKTS